MKSGRQLSRSTGGHGVGWTRHDDRRPFTAKMAGLSDAAYRLDDELLSWCAANGTDGRITARLMPTISPRSARRRVVAELVANGRLHQAGGTHCGHRRCPTPGPDGYSVHDYLEFNPTVAEAAAGKAAAAARQTRRRASLSRDLSRVTDTVTTHVTDAVSHGVDNGVTSTSARVDPDPDPLVVALGGDVAVGGDHEPHPPPSTCPNHPDGTADACGPCGDARRRRLNWDSAFTAEQRRIDAARRSRDTRARAEAAALAIAACPTCDGRGYVAGTVCDHDPATPGRARRGAAAARAALTNAAHTTPAEEHP
jgi:hypothetical protein